MKQNEDTVACLGDPGKLREMMPTPEPDQEPDALSPDEREDFYLPSEVAELFGVTVETIADWCARGILVAVATEAGESRILASSLKGGRESRRIDGFMT